MSFLGPLKFHPLLKNKIWGGDKIKTILKHDFSPLPNCGELWAVSGVEGNESIVSHGPLEGNTLNELLEVYMGELVGDSVFDIFQLEFPLLIKFIDANDWLSVQVHPDDELAELRGLERGKTEMWHIIQADNDSKLIKGFSENVSKTDFIKRLADKKLPEVLNYENVLARDSFYIQAGTIHAIGPGILLAEIQQSSDTTYRVYDWDRVDDKGEPRDLHVEEATDAIYFKAEKSGAIDYANVVNQSSPLVDEQYFTTQVLEFDKPLVKNYDELDSFVIYVVTEGSFILKSNQEDMGVGIGDVILLPASLNKVELHPLNKCHLLEVYIKA